MIIRRRMMMQLTSLVDLLFIVMFLQYMELQDASERQTRVEAVRRQLSDTARIAAETARGDADQLKRSALANTESLTRQLQGMRGENDKLRHDLEEARQQLAHRDVEIQEGERKAARDMKSIADVVQEMIGINPDSLLAVLKGAPDEERAKLRQKIEEMRTEPHAKLVQHLRETAELRKYCDIWEVHVGSDNSVRLSFPTREGGKEDSTEHFFPRSDDEVANHVVSMARAQGQPRSLVIVCLTWGNADLRTREMVAKGLNNALIALKPAWGGGTRIELARLGYAESP